MVRLVSGKLPPLTPWQSGHSPLPARPTSPGQRQQHVSTTHTVWPALQCSLGAAPLSMRLASSRLHSIVSGRSGHTRAQPAGGSTPAAASLPALCGTSGLPDPSCTAALVASSSLRLHSDSGKHVPVLMQSSTRGGQAGGRAAPVSDWQPAVGMAPLHPCTELKIRDCECSE